MLILGEHSRQRDQRTQSVPGVSGNSKEDGVVGMGLEQRWMSQGRGDARACQTLLTWEGTWAFTLCCKGSPYWASHSTMNQASLGCKVQSLKYKPRGSLLAHGTGNSEGWCLFQAPLDGCSHAASWWLSLLFISALLCIGFILSACCQR